MKRIKNLAVIGLLVVAMFAVVMPVSAETKTMTAWASSAVDVNINGEIHKGLVYKIPHGTLYYTLAGSDPCNLPDCSRPYVGGVDLYTLNLVAPEHGNPQKWDYNYRRQLDANWDETVLLVPRRYAYTKWNYASEIYLTVYWR